jgi:hypothetical protein
MPGETYWIDAENFLSSFVLEITDMGHAETGQLYLIVAPVSEEIDSFGRFDFNIFVGVENYRKYVQQIIITNGWQMDVSEVLEGYGEPDQILFWSSGRLPGDIDPEYYLILVYENRGIRFIYFGSGLFWATEGDRYIEVCNSSFRELSPRIQLWNPSETNEVPFVGLNGIWPLEAVSNTTINKFYSSVVNENNDFCFHSGSEFWE